MNLDFSRTPASLAILSIIVLFSVLAFRLVPAILTRNLLRPYWMIKERDYGTLITSGFIHADVGHLLFNGITLLSFGPVLEDEIGTERFLALYFVGLVLSSLGTVVKQRKNPDYAALGASGAILAVMFAFIVYFPTSTLYMFFLPIPIPALLFAVLYMGYTWWASKNRRDNINHDAHFDGALVGLIFVAVTDIGAYQRAIAQLG